MSHPVEHGKTVVGLMVGESAQDSSFAFACVENEIPLLVLEARYRAPTNPTIRDRGLFNYFFFISCSDNFNVAFESRSKHEWKGKPERNWVFVFINIKSIGRQI